MSKKKIVPQAEAIPGSQFPVGEPVEYYTVLQGQMTSIVMKNLNSPVCHDKITNEGIIENNDKKLIFENYTDILGNIGLTAKQLFLALIIEATEGRITNSTIRLPIEKYMNMRELKDKKEARKQVKADLKVLKTVCIKFKEKRKGVSGEYLNINLYGGTEGIVNGVIIFKSNTDFFDCLNSYNIAPLSKEILKLNQKYNPNSFYFLERISSHRNMNEGKTNQNIIGVKTLLESTPLIPKYEGIKDQGRINQRIIDPFDRDMEAIPGLLWHYCGTNGTQVDQPVSYEEFIKALIYFKLKDYPVRVKKT
jgi:hypothetical protein